MGTQIDIWPVLLPVLIGGLVGVLGTIAGPITSGLLQGAARRQELLLQKFEELAQRVYEYQHWMDRFRKARIFGEDPPSDPAPIFRAKTLAAIYFPTFNDPLQELYTAGVAYEYWQLQAGSRRLNGDLKNLNDGLTDAVQPFNDSMIKVREAIQSQGAKLRHAQH